MNKVEIYQAMRIWENITRNNKDLKNEITELETGEKTFEPEPFEIYETADSLEAKIANLKELIKENESEKNEIADKLFNEGIDVEYIVTNTYPTLKQGAWLHNYYIEQNKIENAGYKYVTYEHDVTKENERKTYDTLSGAVEEILSYYTYLTEIETVEEVLEKLDYMNK